MRMLDLYCGAGGAAMGYRRAGIDEIVGVDIRPQPRYPFDFVQADALSYPLDDCDCGHGLEAHERINESFGSNPLIGLYCGVCSCSSYRGFDLIHASPPCQRYSQATPPERRAAHPDLIAATRARLAGRLYVIENVPGARRLLHDPVRLCGSMFGLPLIRHRYFEVPFLDLRLVKPCQHDRLPVVVTGTTRRKSGRFEYPVADCRRAMEIDWMTREELDEAIPPAYTEWIGRALIDLIEARSCGR